MILGLMRGNYWRVFILCVLVSFATPSLLFASVTQMRNDQSTSQERFRKERIEAITKVAGLTSEEVQLVSIELNKYDEARLTSWTEIRKVYDEIGRRGGKVTSAQYLEYYKKIQELTEMRHQASQDFMNALIQHLTPEKAFKVYEEYRKFNANTGRQLRRR